MQASKYYPSENKSVIVGFEDNMLLEAEMSLIMLDNIEINYSKFKKVKNLIIFLSWKYWIFINF